MTFRWSWLKCALVVWVSATLIPSPVPEKILGPLWWFCVPFLVPALQALVRVDQGRGPLTHRKQA